jgi:putative transposase
MSTAHQLSFKLPTHGGKRPGAGRKPKGDEALVSHASRPKFNRVTPAHVTLRVNDAVPSLRSSRRFAVIRRCFAAARGRHGLRLVEFSVLSNHLHLVVEADTSDSLSRGMQGLNVRLAKALNAVLDRTGNVFADHYHSRLLLSPTEVAWALRYVRGNAGHDYGETDPDFFSSSMAEFRKVLGLPRGWLLTVGWKRGRPRQPGQPPSLETRGSS